ncbi:hypothetical protein ACFOY4_18005 [Actinomadura syzygii]|uniref:hypothetical protein n=1 Tax=Actinomadura syzygii TaxID=1427538 RepID=UPI001651E463|nr:hypothetical protein [Actinomadura syzygii]
MGLLPRGPIPDPAQHGGEQSIELRRGAEVGLERREAASAGYAAASIAGMSAGPSGPPLRTASRWV